MVYERFTTANNSKQMTTIALDFDDTLVDTFTVLHDWIENEFGYRIAEEQLARYELDPSSVRTREIVTAFFRSGADLAVQPHSGAVAGCRHFVDRGFELIVITSRTVDLADQTRLVIDRLFPGIFKDVHCVGHLPDKTPALQASRVELFVDDHFRHVQCAEEAGVASILFGDLPWNREARWPRRAEDWPHLMRICGDLGSSP